MQAFDALDSDTSKLVVLYLQRVGDATPDRISNRLDLPLMTVFATVRCLDEKGLIRRLEGSDRIVLTERQGPGQRLEPMVETTHDSRTASHTQ
jgi:Mn-dependent DtxR family transcriptional regulator